MTPRDRKAQEFVPSLLGVAVIFNSFSGTRATKAASLFSSLFTLFTLC